MSKRKPRNSNRGKPQYFEDAFSDLDVPTQERLLETLNSLHRWTKRERSRKPQTGNEAEAAGRAAYAAAVAGPSELLMDVGPQPVDSAYVKETKQ